MQKISPALSLRFSIARTTSQDSAWITRHPEVGLFGVNLTGNAHSVEVGSPNSPEVSFREVRWDDSARIMPSRNQAINGMLIPRSQSYATIGPRLLFVSVYYSRVNQGPVSLAEMKCIGEPCDFC